MAHITYDASESQNFRTVSVLKFLTGTMGAWRQRQALKSLDDQMLGDIGVNYKTAKREASKPVWNVPAHWLR